MSRTSKNQKLKVAIVQRICPEYRVPLFNKLAAHSDIDTTLYFGKSQKSGSQVNAACKKDFRHVELFTCAWNLRLAEKSYYVVFHPSLIIELIKGDFDVIITEGGKANLLNNIWVYIYSIISNTPVIWWDSGPIPGKHKTITGRLSDHLAAFFIRRASACMGYSKWAVAYLEMLRGKRGGVALAPNTIEDPTVTLPTKQMDALVLLKKREMNLDDKKIILYVGALEIRKKVEVLLKAFFLARDEIPSLTLLVVGDGPEAERLHKLAESEQVRFLGRRTNDVNMFFALCDLFVLPGEGGLAINQAMYWSKPVIATVADGTEMDLVVNGSNGYLVEPDDPEALAGAIISALSNDVKVMTMGQASRQHIVTSFSMQRLVDAIVKATKNACSAFYQT